MSDEANWRQSDEGHHRGKSLLQSRGDDSIVETPIPPHTRLGLIAPSRIIAPSHRVRLREEKDTFALHDSDGLRKKKWRFRYTVGGRAKKMARGHDAEIKRVAARFLARCTNTLGSTRYKRARTRNGQMCSRVSVLLSPTRRHTRRRGKGGVGVDCAARVTRNI